MDRDRLAVSACLLLLLASCGGAGSRSNEFVSQALPLVPDAVEIAIIGNSITRHEVSPAKQWNHDGGMAASDKKHDYAHVLMSMEHIPEQRAYIRNFYPFETNGASAGIEIASLKPVMDKHPSYTVIALGDNVSSINILGALKFRANYEKLLDAIDPHSSVVCLSTFWSHAVADYIISDLCERHHFHFANIGGISKHGNPGAHFANSGVDRHPKDAAMRQIATIVFDALKN